MKRPTTRVRVIGSALTIALMIVSAACNDKTIANIAKAELAVSTACSTAFQVVSQANAQNPPLISTADSTAIIGTLLKIEQANQQAETATQQISQLNAANQASLLQIVQPLQTAITNAINQNTLGIADSKTKTAVLAALTAVNTAITTVVTIIQAVKTA